MKTNRILLIGALVLAMVASLQAAVNCGSVNMYIKPPDSWTTLWYEAGGEWTQVPASSQQSNGFWKFNMTGGQGDNFIFGSSNSYYPNNWIDSETFGEVNKQSRVNFTCAMLGSATDYYISEDLANPMKTYASSTPPDAKYFYFLPPDESEWFQGNAMMIINGGTPIAMDPDPDRCGWYKVIYFNEEPPTSVLFTLDIGVDDFVIGEEGLDAAGDPLPANLSTKFSSVNPSGNTLYFNAEEGLVGWYATDPGDVRQCSYDMAALIYDTDASLHGAFSCSPTWFDSISEQQERQSSCATLGLTYYNAQSRIPCIGVTKGIVQSTLGSNRKPVYNTESACFESTEKFNQLFVETANVNKQHCVDLSFNRSQDGLWEFDSYNETGKGFYPLETEPNSGFSTKRTAFGGILMGTGAGTLATDNVNSVAFASGLFPSNVDWSATDPNTGLPYIDLYPTQNGEFAGGTGPNVYNNEAWGACPNTGKPGVCRETALKNQHFCFETHADFVYRPGQRFYFRGDDDIWVFINNKLVVDLGGTHLAAPDYVNLDTIIGIQNGQTYPIDIFFCDRRTDMSNIRIKTNMYFEQKKTLYWKSTTSPTGTVYTLEKLQTGGSSCAALKTNQTDVIIPSSDLDLVYTLVSTRGETMDGDPTTPSFLDSNLVTGVKVYGGILISNGAVTLDTTKLSGLPPGRYRIVIYENGFPGTKTTITFKISGNTGFYSVKRSQTTLTQRPAVDTLAGRLVPFEVAKMFNNILDSSEASFILTIPDGLQVYKDSLGTQPVGTGVAVSTNDDGTIDDGVITLWATGSRKTAADTVTYMLQIKGSKNPPLYLKYHQPRLAFVADSTSLTPLGDPKPSLGVDQGNFAFVNIPTYMIAYDPADGSLCLDCNDTLVATTSDSLSFTALDGGAVLAMSKGRIVIRVRGFGGVTAGSFVVDGPTPWMTDNWTNINLERPPVPVPTFAGMFDRNADGIADSLHITFDRSIRDTMPDFLVIRWPSSAPDTLVLQGKTRTLLDRTSSDTLLEPFFPAENANQVINLLTTDGLNFSYNFAYDQIDTRSLGQVDAWFTFQNKSGQTFQQPITADIEDKMAPIVSKVRIKIAQGGQLFDTLRVAFSEPIDTTGFYTGVTPFEFRELAILDGLTPHAVPAQITVMRPTLDTMLLLYNKDIQHPRAGDSLRISILTTDFLVKDVRGNPRSLSNSFVLIEGDKRNELATLHYVVLDPKTAEERTQSKSPVFIDKVGIYDDLDKVTSYINTQHGAVLGHIVKTDLSETFSKYSATYQVRAGKPLTPADVVLHYETSYHTSIGGFVASSKGSISCADSIFGGNCNSNQNGYVFVGWNLTSNEHRLVGTGAYVARIRTWVDIPVLGKIGEATLSKDRIWGVLRKNGIINK